MTLVEPHPPQVLLRRLDFSKPPRVSSVLNNECLLLWNSDTAHWCVERDWEWKCKATVETFMFAEIMLSNE